MQGQYGAKRAPVIRPSFPVLHYFGPRTSKARQGQSRRRGRICCWLRMVRLQGGRRWRYGLGCRGASIRLCTLTSTLLSLACALAASLVSVACSPSWTATRPHRCHGTQGAGGPTQALQVQDQEPPRLADQNGELKSVIRSRNSSGRKGARLTSKSARPSS